MRRLILPLLFYMISLQLIGQNSYSFHPPIKIPMVLSGNFGEIRTDHFHSGIDIKTGGSTGHQLFAIEDGYVSRIKVQANGYGKSLYINHPNGLTSVYGHLDRYRDDIAAYVKHVQYQRHSFMVNIYPDPGEFRLTKGDLVAYSGNSGSSSGPHLHFEIRTTAKQHPTNVLKYGFTIEDRIPPRFYKVYIYPVHHQGSVNGQLEKFSSTVVKDNGVYTLPWGTVLEAAGNLGISVEVFDLLNGAYNRCGVYSLEMYVDDRLTYKYVMDEFSFAETRYVNAHMDYPERISTGVRAHRLHRLPGDRLHNYKELLHDGVVTVDENRAYKIKVIAADVAGNRSVLKFTISGNTGIEQLPVQMSEKTTTMHYDVENRFEDGDVSLTLPLNALYDDLEFTFGMTPPAHGSLSPFYHISDRHYPVHKRCKLAIRTSITDPALTDKLLLITLDEDHETTSAGGVYERGSVTSDIRSFGEYAIGIDTIAPEIRSLNGDLTKEPIKKRSLRFIIRDDLSGIERYEGYIDQQWALFEYDLKNDLLIYKLDAQRIERDRVHELELYVSDAKGNVNLFQTSFTW